jgi:hypothetical protein
MTKTIQTAARLIARETGECSEKIARKIARALAAGNADAAEIIRITAAAEKEKVVAV